MVKQFDAIRKEIKNLWAVNRAAVWLLMKIVLLLSHIFLAIWFFFIMSETNSHNCFSIFPFPFLKIKIIPISEIVK